MTRTQYQWCMDKFAETGDHNYKEMAQLYLSRTNDPKDTEMLNRKNREDEGVAKVKALLIEPKE